MGNLHIIKRMNRKNEEYRFHDSLDEMEAKYTPLFYAVFVVALVVIIVVPS